MRGARGRGRVESQFCHSQLIPSRHILLINIIPPTNRVAVAPPCEHLTRRIIQVAQRLRHTWGEPSLLLFTLGSIVQLLGHRAVVFVVFWAASWVCCLNEQRPQHHQTNWLKQPFAQGGHSSAHLNVSLRPLLAVDKHWVTKQWQC